MRGVTVAASALLALVSWQADASPCDVSVAEVMERTAASFERRTPSGRNIFLKHHAVQGFIVFCGVDGDAPKSVGGSWDDLYPPQAFFPALAAAGSVVTSGQASRIEAAVRDCYKRALAGKGERGSGAVRAGPAYVTCNTTRMFEGSVLVTISQPGG